MTETSIASQIAQFNRGFEAQIRPELSLTFAQEQADLRSAGSPAGTVSAGDRLPEATLLGPGGQDVVLAEVLGSSAGVLVFYRGAWCPYCNITLRTYQRELLPSLTEQGIKLIAISPQHPEGSAATAKDAELDFAVLSDPGNHLAAALGIVTEPSPEARSAHTQLGFEVSDSNADSTAAIPFPTVAVVDASRTIRFVDVHADYTSRTEVADILAAVRSL